MEQEPSIIDVAIIGFGPAGMTAGIYAARAGYRTVAFESLVAGGQIGNTDRVDNYPGFPEGIGGFDLAYAMKQQADRFGVESISAEVQAVDLQADPKVITTTAQTYEAKTVIIASGARSRSLGVEGEEELRGRGISYCATCDGNFFKDKTVMVIGGANTAVEDSLYLANICKKVIIVYRRDRVRATAIYTEAAEKAPNIEFKYHAVVDELHQKDGMFCGARIKNVDDGTTEEIAADGLFVAIGTIPNTELYGGQIELDRAGYIVAGEDCKTSLPGVYVAGDIRVKGLRQVVTAVADGAVAADAATTYLMTADAEHR